MARVFNGCQRSCWSTRFLGVCGMSLAKRSKALWGHNLTRDNYPAGVAVEDCQLSHTRVAWRLESGRAVSVAHEVYRCGNACGKSAGLLGRSEFGKEIFIALAYQVYCLGCRSIKRVKY